MVSHRPLGEVHPAGYLRVVEAVGDQAHDLSFARGETVERRLVLPLPLIAGPLQVIFGALQGVGPAVSHEAFTQVLFASPILPSTPITPQVSFGNRGFFPDPDYAALDDQTEIWWDAEATGKDELKKDGSGMWRYVDGGKRVLPGEWDADAESKLFEEEGSVIIYEDAPKGSELPEYEPLKR